MFLKLFINTLYYIIKINYKDNIYIGELNNNEKNKLGKYINININKFIKIYKYLRIFYLNDKGYDITKYYIKVSIKIYLSNEPDNIYINFKIVKNIIYFIDYNKMINAICICRK